MSPFSAFRSITGSVRIKTLPEYLRSLKGFRRRIFRLVPRGGFTEMSDPLSRMPRGLVCVSSWFCFEHVVPLCCVTSPGSCVRARSCLLLVLRCYGFTKSWMVLGWSLQPMVRREIRVQLPDCQRAAS